MSHISLISGPIASRTTRTNEAGIYSFPAMVPGPYQVKVEAPGFQSTVRSNIELQVQQTARVALRWWSGKLRRRSRSAARP